MRNNKGFSLVELIVVIAIMAILAAVAIPTFATFITKAQEASDKDFVAQVQSAADLAFATEQTKPSDFIITYNSKDSTIDNIKFTVGTVTCTIPKSGNVAYEGTATKAIEDACAEFKNVVDMNYTFKAAADNKNIDGCTLKAKAQ